jgi:hypothetical protein
MMDFSRSNLIMKEYYLIKKLNVKNQMRNVSNSMKLQSLFVLFCELNHTVSMLEKIDNIIYSRKFNFATK